MVKDAKEEVGPIQARENDPRTTRIGRFLRATAMDELPQLINILKGDMSFVGPRALRPDELEVRVLNPHAMSIQDIPGFKELSQVRPGFTGIAQVYAPRDVPRIHKFKYDLIYIKSQSLWLDIKLILLSLWITLCGKWESRAKKF